MNQPSSVDAHRFRSLDAWRGICALIVAATHFHTNGYIHSSLLVQRAGRFVDFFFVLSGFVIAHAYRHRLKGGGAWSFLMRRVGRLWPLHLVTLGATVLMAIAGSFLGLTIQGFVYGAIFANVTMTHSWGFLDRLTWNGPSWSISTEMFAYILFALLGWRLRGLRLDIACVIVLIASLLVMAQYAPDFQATYDFGIARCLVGFMAGVLTARLWELTRFRPMGEIFAVCLTFVAVVLLPDRLGGLIVPVFAWTVLVFASDAGVVSRILKTASPQLLGRVSYSIYMTHYIIGVTIITGLTLFTGLTQQVDGTATVVADWRVADALSLTYLAVVVAVSCLTFSSIERPGRRWFNQRAEAIPAAW